MEEVKKDHFGSIIGIKIVFLSHGGQCIKLNVNSKGMVEVEPPSEFQVKHEKAATLLAFHVPKNNGRIMVRSFDTDVLIILVGLAMKMISTSIIMMDYGSSNNRRIINISEISSYLEEKQIGMSEALIGFHALTGCNFNSAFYKKGKASPFNLLEKDANHVHALTSLCSEEVDIQAVTKYVCRVYGFKGISDINEARYQSFMKLTKATNGNINLKKINCASLPPCEKTLKQHVLHSNYVSIMLSRANTPEPTRDIHPQNF